MLSQVSALKEPVLISRVKYSCAVDRYEQNSADNGGSEH